MKTATEELNMMETILNNKPFDKPGILSPEKEDIVIKEVVNKHQLKAFIDFPYRLYKGNPYYVPQLKKDVENSFDKNKNPAFEFCEAKCWLACKGDKVVGRIAGIINHAFIEKWKNKLMRFGWLDFEEDDKITKALLHQVELWALEKGMTAVHGPLGFTNFDHAGLLIKGFNQLGTFATLYNYPYYPLFIERAGYGKDVDWVEYKIKVPGEVPEKLAKIASVVEKRYNLSVVKTKTTKDILPYAKNIFRLVNSAYEGLYGMVAMNERQIEYNVQKYFSYIRPDFVSLVVDKNSELAAFGITMPSLSLALQKAQGSLYPFGFFHLLKAFRKNNLTDMCLVAVRKDLQGKGVNALLMHELNKTYIKNGVTLAESNPELEENAKVQSIWEHYDAVQHKRRRCYIKYL
jgi:GNAT superfamily N-acetyltransferase